ncbi:uncharacterized protein LOC131183460 [Hevea brasiliensis]|uniref:uncharacterized protein LOC131183460 n=1 Tax=Hevea brasiliensis TaxID=3981 RepID=UPI0025FDE44D|nr:uncharacterized protein LOC131183460 [Hevea brasiliensis]
MAERWHNSSSHSNLKMSPFQALYGYAPPQFFSDNLAEISVRKVEDWVLQKQRIMEFLRQVSVRARKHAKPSAKFFGTYKIVQKVGAVAYQFQLPADVLIHNVFHVSLLKHKLGVDRVVQSALPSLDSQGQFSVKPLAVLDTRSLIKDGRAAQQVPIQWNLLSVQDATCEDKDFILHQFQDFILEDKNVLAREDNVRIGVAK